MQNLQNDLLTTIQNAGNRGVTMQDLYDQTGAGRIQMNLTLAMLQRQGKIYVADNKRIYAY